MVWWCRRTVASHKVSSATWCFSNGVSVEKKKGMPAVCCIIKYFLNEVYKVHGGTSAGAACPAGAVLG